MCPGKMFQGQYLDLRSKHYQKDGKKIAYKLPQNFVGLRIGY
jgi:hypothetical protein